MIRFLSAVILVASIAEATAPVPQGSPDWSEVSVAAEQYRAHPGTATARRLLAAIPDRPLSAPPEVFELLWSLVDTIQHGGQTGQQAAVELGFRLLRVSDAAFGEDLSVSLGSVATSQPKLFLTVLSSVLRKNAWASDPTEVVTSFDPDLDSVTRHAEHVRRVAALQSVRTRSLRSLRDTCLMQLAEPPIEEQ